MVTVKKLYGVSDLDYIVPGGTTVQEMSAGQIGNVATHVGRDLRDELMSLPKRTKVGVQYFSELCDGGIPHRRTIRVKNTSAYISCESMYYWAEILDICKMRGLDVEFIDDYATFREVAKKLVEKNQVREQIRTIELNNPESKVKIKKQKGELEEDLYRLEVEADYLHVIKRSDKILEEIIRECPEVVIVGKRYADYFMANPKLMETIRVRFEKYAREQYEGKADLSKLPLYIEKPPEVFGKLVQDAEPNRVELAGREKIERQYRAITLGRILVTKEPAWIGTWDTDIPAKGLFEVHVEQDMKTFHGVTALEGKVEDVYGSARFTGSTDDSTLIFRKEYDEMAVAIGGFKGPIMYETPISGGTMDGLKPGVFRGQFTPLEVAPKPFYIREFSEDLKLEKLRRA